MIGSPFMNYQKVKINRVTELFMYRYVLMTDGSPILLYRMYNYLMKSLNATKQTLHKHVSKKMLSVHNGSFLSTDILAPSSREVYLTFTEKRVF